VAGLPLVEYGKCLCGDDDRTPLLEFDFVNEYMSSCMGGLRHRSALKQQIGHCSLIVLFDILFLLLWTLIKRTWKRSGAK